MHAVTKQSLNSNPNSARVFSALKKAIVNGDYENSERLPPERRLSEIYGVARNTIRLVLQRLDMAHLVEHETGRGTYVSFDNQQHRELLDVIKQRDPENATRIVAQHLLNVKNDLLGTP